LKTKIKLTLIPLLTALLLTSCNTPTKQQDATLSPNNTTQPEQFSESETGKQIEDETSDTVNKTLESNLLGNTDMVPLSDYLSDTLEVTYDAKSDTYVLIENGHINQPYLLKIGEPSYLYNNYRIVMDDSPALENNELYVSRSFTERLLFNKLTGGQDVEPLTDYETENISRKNAGLDSIAPLDFQNIQLNSRLKELLSGDKYLDSDFTKGIVKNNILITADRFKEIILTVEGEPLQIGDSLSKLIKVLGSPNIPVSEYDPFYCYKTDSFYIGFVGTDVIEAVVLYAPDPSENINMKDLIDSLAAFPCLTDENHDWYEINHINGGGYLVEMNSIGISITEFDQKYVEVYNNFEDELYQFKGIGNYEIRYINQDALCNYMYSQFAQYQELEDNFKTDATISPNGTYSLITYWRYSMDNGLIIRTNDFSKPDMGGLGSGDLHYQWLNDNHIFYGGRYGNPNLYIRNVENEYEIEVLEQFKLQEEPDILKYNFDNPVITSNSITFYHETEKNKEFTVNFKMNDNGNIELTSCNFNAKELRIK